jgi:hypothetical protein
MTEAARSAKAAWPSETAGAAESRRARSVESMFSVHVTIVSDISQPVKTDDSGETAASRSAGYRAVMEPRVDAMVTLDDVRVLALSLPRTTEAFVYGRVKFRVGRIVYLAFSRDETVLGFAFPKEEREWLVGTEPHKFLMPTGSDLRWNWVEVRLAAIDITEMREIVFDAWRMVVPKSVAAAQQRELLE